MTDTPDLHTRSCPRCHSIGDPRIIDRTLGSNEPIHCHDPWHAGSAEPPRAGRFEELLAAEHEQFDHRSELLASVVEYRDAPSGTASAPRADPPDTPDLRTLADVFVRAALDCGLSELPPGEQRKYLRGLAAVLPAHRRQVLAEAAEVLAQDALCNEDTRYDSLAGAAVVVRRLASAAPETAPSPRQDDETAPAVPEQALAPAEGSGTWHVGRSWTGHHLEDDCPCPKGPCGLATEPFDPECPEHPHERAKSMRQGHRAAECPGAGPLSADVVDESPWRVGSHYGIHLYRQAGAEPGDDDEPIGTMLRPELAAQVVAEHRHAVEYRAMLRDAERGPEGRRDDTAALAARLGFVPVAERDALAAKLDMVCDVLGGAQAERDKLREAVMRVRALADRAFRYDYSLVPDQIYAALDGTDPKAGDDQ